MLRDINQQAREVLTAVKTAGIWQNKIQCAGDYRSISWNNNVDYSDPVSLLQPIR